MVCFCGGREPGCAPGGAPSFLVSPRKEGKRRRPYCLRPLRCATGQPGVLGCGVRRVTHCAPAALRSDRRGESVDEARVCPAAHPRHPASCAPQAHTEGGWQPNSPTAQQPHGPLLRSAPMGAGALRRAAPGRAQRWPEGVSGFGFPSGCAEERSGQRIRARDCLSAAGASSSETPLDASTAGCPQRSEGTQRVGSLSLW